MKQLIRHILKEETLKTQLLQMIEDDGVESTAELVGGIDNLMDTIGRSYINDILISSLGDLKLSHRGGDVSLVCKGLPLIEKSFWGYQLWVYDEYIKSSFYDKSLIKFYKANRRSLIKELVSRYPELYKDDVTVYADIGKYHWEDEFTLK